MVLLKRREIGLIVFSLMLTSFIISTEFLLSENALLIQPLSSNDDTYEENDTYDQAYEIEKGWLLDDNEGLYEGILQDEDWYVIDLIEGGNLSVLIIIYEEENENVLDDVDVRLYSSDHQTQVGEIALGQGILELSLESAPSTGSYYVHLNPLSAISLEYMMYVWPLMDDEYEENDEISLAKEIYENYYPYDNGEYLFALDDDWYKVYLEPGWIMEFYVMYLSYADFQIEVLGTDGTTTLDVEFLYEDEIIQIGIEFELSGDLISAAGFYYIKIAPLHGNSLYMMEFEISGNSLQSPILYPIIPNPNDYGYIEIDWNSNNDVGSYSIYREVSVITSVSSLTPIAANIESSNYYDEVTEDGTYYYAVTSNTGGESSLPSNCASVEVIILPFSERRPTLDPIYWDYEDYGQVRLRWESFYGADYYLVFRDTLEITDYSSLEHIGLVTASYPYSQSWYDDLDENGTYYYVIVGVSGGEQSMVSNCESVSIEIIPFNQRFSSYLNVNPSYTEDGHVNMYWSSVRDAQMYYLYRDTIVITDISGLDPISIQTGTSYEEELMENGIYYYCVLPYNGVEFGLLSECDSVDVNLVPFTERVPQLYSIGWHETSYDKVYLNWNRMADASGYLIYRDTSEIVDIAGMEPIGTGDYSSYIDYVPENGTYYYVILATNGMETSRISNCESVTVNILPFYDRILTYFQVSPAATDTGEIHIYWEPLHGALDYSLYRETFEITDISSLTPIQVFYGGDNGWTDYVDVNGTYWYAIVANNGTVNCTLSVSQPVVVAIIPFSARTITYLHGDTGLNYDWIYLDWNTVYGATNYEIYRDTSEITDLIGLTFVDTTSSSSWEDYVPYNSTYYYVVRAFNGSSYTPISECVMIEQIFMPFYQLEPNFYNVEGHDDGRVILDWGSMEDAETYEIYRDTSVITDISGMTPIHTSYDRYDTYYTDYVAEDGLYYYVVVGNNGTINSKVSNCRSVYIIIVPFHERTPNLWCEYESSSGEVRIEWDSFYEAEMYYIYRLNFQPNGIDGLSPIAMTPNNFYEETLTENGTFYYVVVGYDGIQLTHVSNSRRVDILILPISQIRPQLQYLTYHAEYNEVFMYWRSIPDAVGYYIYRDTSVITDISGLDPVGFQIDDGSDEIGFHDYPEGEGHYYYAIVAFNGYQMSLPSISDDVWVFYSDFALLAPSLDIWGIWTSKGVVELGIEEVNGAESFYIYRDTSPIGDISGLDPIDKIEARDGYWTVYYDIVPDNGSYYYVVVANNGTVNSSISYCRDVDIYGIQDVISPESFGGGFYDSGRVFLSWDYQESAAEYLIYRELSNITDLGGLTPYASTQDPSFYDYSISANGSYYYVVVAKNGFYTSAMSNCLNITVNMFEVQDSPVITQVYRSDENQIYIDWDAVSFASIYYIYRDLAIITDISSLEPVGVSYGSSYYYDDPISEEGNYYYAVVAGNGASNSSISNCMNATVEFNYPNTPIMLAIEPPIDDDGIIYLEWDNIPFADGYHIYRCNSTVFDPSELILIGNAYGNSYTDWISENHVYYYTVVAYNEHGFSDMSNVVSVENNRPALPNYAFVDTPYDWIDSSSNPLFQQGEGTEYLEIDLQFDFEFYGISYSSVYVSQNGYLSFTDSIPVSSGSSEFPTSEYDMDYVISPFMQYFGDGFEGTVSGLNGSGYCVITWENMEYNGGYNVSFQVILYDDGSIKFQYDYIGYVENSLDVGINLGDGIHGESYQGLTTQTDDFAFKYVPFIENANPAISLPSDISYYYGDVTTHTLSWMISDANIYQPIYRIVVDGEVVVDDLVWSSGATINFDVTGWDLGQHLVTIFVEDGYGAVIVDYVWIFVEDVPVILSPGNLNFEEGTNQPQILTWNISDSYYNHPTYDISVDGVMVVENEPWPGAKLISYDVSSFSVGNYVVVLVVDDGRGNTATDAIVVSVVEAATVEFLPVITAPADISYIEGSPGSYIISWTITDETVDNPTYTIEVNTQIVVENEPWFSGQTIEFNVSGWDVGTYTVVITVNDGNSGEVVDAVVVSVETASPTETGQSIFEGIPGFSIFYLMGFSIITLIFVKKRRKL